MEGNVRGIIAGTTREFHPDLCTMGNGSFFREYSGWDVALTAPPSN